jgi:hypothetical protein
MTTASTGVAVIATDIAQTDRRALSEAWYSALHLADNTPSPAPRATRAGAPPTPASLTQSPPLSSRAESSDSLNHHHPDNRPGPERSRGTATIDRRQPATESSRRIERAVVTLSARRPVPAAHTVDVDGGRVRLLVHTDGRRTRIVAVCSSPLRDVVERALASARFTLAGAGLAVGAP